MIRLENTMVQGWEAALRGMRNPMNSWAQSDTKWPQDGGCTEDGCPIEDVGFILGDKDEDLMRRLVRAGSDHRKFLRFITVSLDITAPLYWWKEFKTYRVGRKFAEYEPDLIDPEWMETDVETDSCSTMHKIHAKPFERADFSHDHLAAYNFDWLDQTIERLNYERDKFNVSEHKDKDAWWQMIQMLPSSYNQRRTVLLNYEVLRNIYRARKNHKLTEWHDFCAWIENLPLAWLITEGVAA